MIETVRGNGLDPNTGIFWEVSWLSTVATVPPKQKEEMELIAKAQMEMNVTTTERRMSSALNKKFSKVLSTYSALVKKH